MARVMAQVDGRGSGWLSDEYGKPVVMLTDSGGMLDPVNPDDGETVWVSRPASDEQMALIADAIVFGYRIRHRPQ
jgi:hypothetical protein